jgi:hypothetical protein
MSFDRRKARALSRERWPQGHLANVFVAPDTPHYEAMKERAQKTPAYEWRYDEYRAGVWVPLRWLRDDGMAVAKTIAKRLERRGE